MPKWDVCSLGEKYVSHPVTLESVWKSVIVNFFSRAINCS